MSDKYFPIKQGVACQLKWTWNTIRLQEGTTTACHRPDGTRLDPDNFDNFHNNPSLIEHRKMMLEGKFPQQGCQFCEKIEAEGGVSDRMTHLKIPNLVPPELELDPTALVVTPRILEVFLDNTCNLACVYCDESNSTRIEQENRRYGYEIEGIPIILKIQRDTNYPVLVERFFSYLDKNYQHFRRLHILGGEPFFQENFDRLMEFVSNNANPELELNIVSNLMVSQRKLQAFVDLCRRLIVEKRIKRLDITASLDGAGLEQEFIRHGLDLETWKKNFEYLAEQRWIVLNVMSTITSLSIKTLPPLVEYLNEIKKTRKIFHAFGNVDERPHLHCRAFGPGFFREDFERVLAVMPEDTVWDCNQKDYVTGLMKASDNDPKDLDELHRLRVYLDELDRRRNQSWRATFPWLSEYFTESNNVV